MIVPIKAAARVGCNRILLCDSQAYCLAHQCNVIMMMNAWCRAFFILVKGRPMICACVSDP